MKIVSSVLAISLGASVLYAQMPIKKEYVQVEQVTEGKDSIERKTIGHMEAISTVDVKPAVEGFIQEPVFKKKTAISSCIVNRLTKKIRENGNYFPRPYQEGDTVQKGDILFFIDNVRYMADLNKRIAAIEEIEAKIIYAKNSKERYETLRKSGAISIEIAESADTLHEELKAALKEAKANLEKSLKDVKDCTIRAEITGRIGRVNFSPGNYVTRGETLATIKQMDPIYVRFPLSQYDVNNIFRGPKEIHNVADVRLTLANGREYGSVGKITIVDNILAGETDSYTLWAEYQNKQNILTPKGIGALNVTLTATQRVAKVPLTAVHYDENYDQTGAYVYTVSTLAPIKGAKHVNGLHKMLSRLTGKFEYKYTGLIQGTVSRKNISEGSIEGRLQSIYSGLEAGEIVITDGSHKIRVGSSIIGKPALHADTAGQVGIKLAEEEPIPVTTATVTQMEDPTVLTCYGARVEAINHVELRPLVQGVLLKQEKKDGSLVKKDDVLFRIDPTRYNAEVNAIKARIEKLNAGITDADSKYNRQLQLAKKATSDEKLQNAKSKLDELKAQKKAAEADLMLAEDNLRRCTVKAPMDGRLGRTFISEGNYISDIKAPLATLIQTSPIYVRLYLSENELLSTYGRDELLRSDAEISLITTEGNIITDGKIQFADNVIKTSTDTQNIWAIFPNDDRALSPGAIVTVKIQRKKDSDARFKPAVPSAAVQVDSEGHYVYTIKHGHARLTRVLCGTPKDGLTPIFAGLKVGDIIITDPLSEMDDECKVTVIPAK